jgi:membrane-bound lytic murein transglycosylase D
MFSVRYIGIVVLWFMPLFAFSNSLADKYPSYEYVFAEFGINSSYIYDDSFEKFVLKNEKKIEHFYKNSIKRGYALLPLVRKNLMDDGLSDLFMYISMIESGFSSSIVSPKKAVGLWQFMPATAKDYKLSVCKSFDERCDPISSTNAAIEYLSKLHKQFGKWYLAVMAYNCGEGRLKKAIKKANSDVLYVLLDNEAKYLPLETRDYIKKILLIAMIGESKNLDFALNNSTYENTLVQVEVLAGTKLKNVAKCIGMNELELLKLNRQFKRGIVPNKKKMYNITIPEDKMANFYLKYEILENTNSIKPHLLSYYVKLGDTLSSIAKKYNSSEDEIKVANNLDDYAIELDKLLLIPVSQELFESLLK